MGAMHRRLLTIALGVWPATHLFAQPHAQLPRRKIPASQLFEALSARFPLRLAAPGVLQLDVSTPALQRSTTGAVAERPPDLGPWRFAVLISPQADATRAAVPMLPIAFRPKYSSTLA
jgi:hypothetical protein